MGPPPPDALEEGWLVGAIDIALSPVLPAGSVAFRIDSEEASLVDGVAVPGVVDGADVLVEGDAVAFYHLVVDRDLTGVRIEGTREVLERLLDGFTTRAEPLPA
jgi:hypothetical protein